MSETTVIIAYIVSNIVALLLLFASWKHKQLARILFSVLFLYAAWQNWTGAHNNPQQYLGFGKYAIGFYKEFISGVFSEMITPFVSFIAIAQLLIGLALLARGIVVKAACLSGIIFLLAIAPLGVGSAFPFSISASIGLYLLYRHHFVKNILNNKWLA